MHGGRAAAVEPAARAGRRADAGLVGAVGDVLVLGWATPRDGFGSPAGSDYMVAVNGAPRAVSAASLAGRAARLDLVSPVAPGGVVTVVNGSAGKRRR